MKKNFAILALSAAFIFAISSCGNGKHRCPAYGSVDAETNDYLVACIDK